MIRLLVVILLLGAVAIALKMRNRGTTTTKSMKITSRAAVSRGAVLLVVEVDGRRLLIGAAPNQINLITELDSADGTQSAGTGGAGGSESSSISPALNTPIQSAASVAQPAQAKPRIRPVTLRATSTPATRSAIDKIRGLTVRSVEPGFRLTARESGSR